MVTVQKAEKAAQDASLDLKEQLASAQAVEYEAARLAAQEAFPQGQVAVRVLSPGVYRLTLTLNPPAEPS